MVFVMMCLFVVYKAYKLYSHRSYSVFWVMPSCDGVFPFLFL